MVVGTVAVCVDAGFEEIHLGQIGNDHRGFCDVHANELLPRL